MGFSKHALLVFGIANGIFGYIINNGTALYLPLMYNEVPFLSKNILCGFALLSSLLHFYRVPFAPFLISLLNYAIRFPSANLMVQTHAILEISIMMQNVGIFKEYYRGMIFWAGVTKLTPSFTDDMVVALAKLPFTIKYISKLVITFEVGIAVTLSRKWTPYIAASLHLYLASLIFIFQEDDDVIATGTWNVMLAFGLLISTNKRHLYTHIASKKKLTSHQLKNTWARSFAWLHTVLPLIAIFAPNYITDTMDQCAWCGNRNYVTFRQSKHCGIRFHNMRELKCLGVDNCKYSDWPMIPLSKAIQICGRFSKKEGCVFRFSYKSRQTFVWDASETRYVCKNGVCSKIEPSREMESIKDVGKDPNSRIQFGDLLSA